MARSLLMGGHLIDGPQAVRHGLADRLSDSDATVLADAEALCARIAGHGPHALVTTKAWLNELDGSDDDARFLAPVSDSIRQAMTDESLAVMRSFLERRFGA